MPRQKLNHGGATLSASAFIIAALIIVQAGRLPSQQAFAETASNRGDFSVLTSVSGRGGGTENPWQVVYVIDSRTETLMVYEVEDARRGDIILRDGGSLENLFRNARK